MWPFLARRQHNPPVLYIGVQRITCTNVEPAAKGAWKNDLAFGGDFGLHGKTILRSLSSLCSGEPQRSGQNNGLDPTDAPPSIFTPVLGAPKRAGCHEKVVTRRLGFFLLYENNHSAVTLILRKSLPAMCPLDLITRCSCGER